MNIGLVISDRFRYFILARLNSKRTNLRGERSWKRITRAVRSNGEEHPMRIKGRIDERYIEIRSNIK